MMQFEQFYRPFLNLTAAVVTLFFILSTVGLAQETGELFGTITDQESGETLIGINVIVAGTQFGSSTDLDGKFMIRKILAGKHDIKISGVGYSGKTITGIVIVAGKPVELSMSLAQEAYNINEIVITAQEVRSTESAILAQRKKSTTISDGISLEQIKRTPDATSADALRRITGLSIVDNKFVYIRGIPDRYNTTTLDGASVASTEADKRGFSFDILPANLIENTTVVKSATPDLPGNFSGGLVQLNTLDFPTNFIMKVTATTASNSMTTGNDILVSQGGSKDWIGVDDGTRAFPENITNNISIAQAAQNTWAPKIKKAPYNNSLSLVLGDRLDFGGENSSVSKIGFIGAFSYRNSFQRNEQTISDAAIGRYLTGNKDDASILWSAMANLSFEFAGLHKISVKNNFNRSANEYIKQFDSDDLNTTLHNLYTVINWTERSAYTGQVTGEHTFTGLHDLAIQWRTSVSSSRRDDPDVKEATYYRDLYDPSQPYTVAVNRRSWSYMNERAFAAEADFSLPLSGVKLKFGSRAERKTTNFQVRHFDVVPDYDHGIPDSLTRLPLETVYSQENFGYGKFLFNETSNASDSYNGDHTLYAGYFMMDMPFEVFSNKFRITGGARLENSEQNLNVPKSFNPIDPVRRIQLKNVDILPSANFTYLISSSLNARFAYSHSVNRPDFREIAPTQFYDFIKYEIVGGNPNLRRSLIKNYDVRLELFPDIGELIAVSYFSKNITDAIEESLLTSSTKERTWMNSPEATNRGFEIELRKSLSFIGGYFKNFSVNCNYTRIESSVEIIKQTGNSLNTQTVVGTRPLQGQSPYMINVSLLFTEPTIGTSINVMYNTFGRRIDAVGFLASDIYEEPRDLVDIAITQPILGFFETKFTVKNLNGKDRILTRDNELYERTSTGRTYSLQLSYNL